MDNKVIEEAKKSKLLNAMAGNFGVKVPADTLDLWLDRLSMYTAEQVGAAVMVVIDTYEYKCLPPFAVVKKALDAVTGQSQAAITDEAGEAWQYMMKQVASVGRNRTPNLPERTAEIMRSLGGWSAVCNWTNDEMPFRKREFVGLWQSKVDGDRVALVDSEQLAIGS